MVALDLNVIDRRVAGATGALEDAANDMHREGRPLPCPLEDYRDVATLSAHRELEEEAEGEWGKALAEWALALTIERVTWVDRARLEVAWGQPPEARSGREVRRAPREILHTLLATSSRPGPRAALADELCDESPASDAARIWAERRVEAYRRSGREPASFVESATAVGDAANDFLDRTDAMLEPDYRRWDEVLPVLLATDATEGWPAALTLRWATSPFLGSGLLDGLRLPPIEMPRAVGASSFALALARLGRAMVQADGSTRAPFVLRRPLLDLRPHRRATLLGSLIADRAFSTTALGLSRHAARDQTRMVSRAMLLHVRLRAVQVLLRDVLPQAALDREGLFEGWTRRAWGVPLPGVLAGVVPRLGPDDSLRFTGAMLGLADRADAVQRYDADWYRNPAAARALREDQSLLPETRDGLIRVEPAALSAGVAGAVSFFEESLA